MALIAGERIKLKQGVTIKHNSNLELLNDKTLIVSHCSNFTTGLYMCTIEGQGPELYGVLIEHVRLA